MRRWVTGKGNEMENGPKKQSRDDARLAMALLQRKVVNEGQLKAALDYQRSLGVRLSEALVKLSILRPQQLEEVSSHLDAAGPDGAASSGHPEESRPEGAIDPATVSIPDLKVHRRLLDKVPPEVVEAGLVVTFFPPSGMPQRKILVGHGRPLSDSVRRKVQAAVGVEICTVALEPDRARAILVASGRKIPEPTADGACTPSDDAEASRAADTILAPHRATAGPSGRESTPDLSGPPAVSSQGPPSFPRPASPRPPSPPPRREERVEVPSIVEGTIGSPPRGAGLGLTVGFSSASPEAHGARDEHPGQEATVPPPQRHIPAMAPTAPPSGRGDASAPRASVAAGGEPTLQALIELLAKKGIITREDLELEIELSRIRQKAGTLITTLP